MIDNKLGNNNDSKDTSDVYRFFINMQSQRTGMTRSEERRVGKECRL